MTENIKNIYQELKKKISPARLKEISVDIINKYREKDRAGLAFYAGLLSMETSGADDSRIFARIIQNYHPDKHSAIIKEIEGHFANKKIEELVRMKNAFLFDRMVQTTVFRHDVVDENEDTYSYSDEDFGYDIKEDYDEIIEEEEEDADDADELTEDIEYGFIEAMNRLVFGALNLAVTIDELHDLDGELDLSDYDIYDLKGVEHCMNINSLNLSGNCIRKIDPLSRLVRLESLFLANNSIENVDCLSGLANLKELDISNNEIEDVAVLDKLESLLYVNLIGNPIRDTEIIRKLSDKGILVVF